MKSFLKKYSISLITTFLVILGVWFFGGQVSGQLSQFEIDWDTVRWQYVWISLIGFPVMVAWHGIVWRAILPVSERSKIGLIHTLRIHTIYWLTRYIPGTAPTLVSKIVAGQEYGIAKRTLVIASMYEQVIQIFTALGVGIILSATAWSLESSPVLFSVITLFGIIIAGIILHPRVFYPLSNRALRVFKREPLAPESLLSYGRLVYLTGLYILGQVGNGVAFFALVKAFVPLENSFVIPLIGFYSLAGVIGVLAIFVPSGIGVREGIMISLLAQFVSIPLAVTISVAARLVNMFSDGLLFLALGGYHLRRFLSLRVVFGIWSLGIAITLIGVSQLYSSSYIDEYWHIFAGREFWTLGQLAELYSTGAYDRGMIISILSGALQSIFGDLLWIQKLIPAGISILTYGCLMVLSRHIWPRQWYLSVFLGAIWALNPWLLFSHQYIRMYVWYEFVFVAGLAVVLGSSTQVWRRWILIQLAVLLGLIGIYWTANDSSVLLPIMGIVLAQAMLLVARPTIGRLTHGVRAIFVVGSAIAVLVSSWGRQQIETFLTKDFIFATQESYLDFFLERNTIVSVFVCVGIIIWLIRGTLRHRVLAVVTGVLITLHLISSPDVQLVRSIFYLLPIVYLVSLVPIWFVGQAGSRLGKSTAVFLSVVLIWGIYQSYPLEEGYLGANHLFIPGEINAIEYQRGYQYLKDQCQGRTVYETSPTPYLGEFYGVEIDAAIITQQEWLALDTIFRSTSEGFVVHYSGVPVVTDIQELDEEFCWIQRTPSLGRYLSVEAINIQATITDFVGIRIVER